MPFPAVDRGIYREAWTVENIPDGAILFNPAPHAAAVEFGSRPFTPPYSVILEWVIRKFKNRITVADKASGRRRGRAARVDRQLVAIAWGVVNKIRRYGIKPRHVMTGGQRQMEAYVQDEMMAIKKDIEEGKI